MDEVWTAVPARLIRDVGFFLVPASRTWDRVVSFGSELFRRVVASGAGQPAESVLGERDRLRAPQQPLEADPHLAPIIARLNTELAGFFRTQPRLHLRVTATDSDGLLEAVVPHYAQADGAPSLPARRHGSGLISLQHLLLLLQFGRQRAEAGEGFWIALEEPELHVPPPLQRRLVHRIQALSTQTFVSTHSPTVAALSDPQAVAVLRNDGGVLTSTPLQTAAFPPATPNAVRKLFQLNRVDTIAAVMHDAVLVPEGRTDHDWLKLLVRAVDLRQGWTAADESRFGSYIGVVPTHDAAVEATVAALFRLHPRVFALVDGDGQGVGMLRRLRPGRRGRPSSFGGPTDGRLRTSSVGFWRPTAQGQSSHWSNRWLRLLRRLRRSLLHEDQYDAQCDAAGVLVERPEVRGWTAASFPIVLVDEAQDLKPQRLKMLRALAQSAKTLIAADEFQCLDASLRPNPLIGWMRGACEPEALNRVRRTNVPALLTAAAAIRGGAAPVAGAGFRILAAQGVPVAAAMLASAIRWRQGGRVAVITPSLQGGFASSVVRRVCENPCGTQRNGPYAIRWERSEQDETAALIDGLQLDGVVSIAEVLAALEVLPRSGAVREASTWVRHQARARGRSEFTRADIEAIFARQVAVRRAMAETG